MSVARSRSGAAAVQPSGATASGLEHLGGCGSCWAARDGVFCAQVVRGDKGSCIYGAGGSVSAQYELPFAMRMRTVCIEYIVTISAGTCVVSSRA